MDDKKKKFVIPEAEVVDFATEDIILTSLTRGVGEALFNGDEDEEW